MQQKYVKINIIVCRQVQNMYQDIIAKCVLFAGLSREDFAYALHYFSAVQRLYEKGDFINRVTAPLENFGLVLSGTLQVYMDDIDGNHMIMANVGEGDTFGESLCYLHREAPVYICSVTDSVVLLMNTERIRHPDVQPTQRDVMLANRFTAMLASRTLAMNDRIQILSKLSIRDKLITFFSQYCNRYGRQDITIPFDRGDMATYLGVNRSALSRELSRMREEGIIDFHKNAFTIKNIFANK